MWRRVLFAVGVAAGVVSLSGCQPASRPLAAVTVDADGTPRAILRPCGGGSYESLSLRGGARSDDGKATVVGWTAKGGRSGDADFPLFAPPAAWQVDPLGEQRLLPGHRYNLRFRHRGDDAYESAVRFSTADLAGLRPGQVWSSGQAMSLGEFEELAEDSC